MEHLAQGSVPVAVPLQRSDQIPDVDLVLFGVLIRARYVGEDIAQVLTEVTLAAVLHQHLRDGFGSFGLFRLFGDGLTDNLPTLGRGCLVRVHDRRELVPVNLSIVVGVRLAKVHQLVEFG